MNRQEDREANKPKKPDIQIEDTQRHLTSSENGEIDVLVDLLPRQYRNKAKLLLGFLKPRVRLDEQMRILYENGDKGSNLLDMIRFYVLPISSKTKRPLDALRFGLWMKKEGVPRSAIGREIVLKHEQDTIENMRGKARISQKKKKNQNGPRGTPKLEWKSI
jgi:hypothetical protein